MSTGNTQDVLTGDEVAAILRVSRDTVYRLSARGELPGRKVGRIWRFPKSAIEEYLRGERDLNAAELRSSPAVDKKGIQQ
jgi:excisionase family DNA binding protein